MKTKIIDSILDELKINDRQRPLRKHEISKRFDDLGDIPIEGIVHLLMSDLVDLKQLPLRVHGVLQRVGRVERRTKQTNKIGVKGTDQFRTLIPILFTMIDQNDSMIKDIRGLMTKYIK